MCDLALTHISAEALGAETPRSLCQRLEEGRPAFLSFLKDCGLKLSDRQGLANALGKAQREGKLNLGKAVASVSSESVAKPAETPDEIEIVGPPAAAETLLLQPAAATDQAETPAAADRAESSAAPIVRLYAVSDVHWDYEANQAWLDALPHGAHRTDAIILAGDLSHVPAMIEQCLRRLYVCRRSKVFTTLLARPPTAKVPSSILSLE